MATRDLRDLQDQENLRGHLAALRRAGEANTQSIRTWRADLVPEPWHYRVHDALESTERTVREIGRFVAERYIFCRRAPLYEKSPSSTVSPS